MSTYPPARSVAPKLRAHFQRLAEENTRPDVLAAPAPSIAEIEALIEATFWTSLRREEGHVPRISLAFSPPECTSLSLHFDSPLALDAHVLTKIAPAIERPGIHLCAYPSGNGLAVWGIARILPMNCFVVEVIAPGLIAVKQRRDEATGKFLNLAVLQGDEVKLIQQNVSTQADRAPVLTALLQGSSIPGLDAPNALIQFAISVRKHGRGGLLLIVPSGTDTWKQSIVRRAGYAASPPYGELATVMEAARETDSVDTDSFLRAIDMMAGFTAVDGATVINDHYELLMFGAKITRRDGCALVDRIQSIDTVEQAVASIVEPAQLGGTRHLSAAQFAHDQHDALALAASQDGRFTIFSWSETAGVVRAHRIEALLL